MRSVLGLFRRLYGANPLQLLVLLACFAISAYAFYRASLGPLPLRMLVWFVVAVVGHDLVLYPLYALADRSWHVASRRVRHRLRGKCAAVPLVNYVRVPVVLSGSLLIAFWGTISGEGEPFYRYAADKGFGDFLGRWLIVTGVLFLASAVLYAWRVGRMGPPRTRPSPTSADGEVVEP